MNVDLASFADYGDWILSKDASTLCGVTRPALLSQYTNNRIRGEKLSTEHLRPYYREGEKVPKSSMVYYKEDLIAYVEARAEGRRLGSLESRGAGKKAPPVQVAKPPVVGDLVREVRLASVQSKSTDRVAALEAKVNALSAGLRSVLAINGLSPGYGSLSQADIIALLSLCSPSSLAGKDGPARVLRGLAGLRTEHLVEVTSWVDQNHTEASRTAVDLEFPARTFVETARRLIDHLEGAPGEANLVMLRRARDVFETLRSAASEVWLVENAMGACTSKSVPVGFSRTDKYLLKALKNLPR